MISMDISTLIDPYLTYYQPRPSLALPVNAQGQYARFKISWLLEKDNAAVTALADSDIFYAVKGGLSVEEWHPSDFFTQLQGKPLSHRSGCVALFVLALHPG